MLLTVGTFFYVAVAGTELPRVLRWFFAGAAVLLLVCAVPVVVLSVAVMADARRARLLASAIPACDKRRGRARDEAVP